MRAVNRAQGAGFTLVEAAVVVAIMGILLAVGMPPMSKWLLARKAAASAVFYQDGFAFARNQAIARNAASRLVLIENAANGQMDWRVDVCLPNLATPCDDGHGTWSTTSTAVAGFTSVQRSAAAMPGEGEIAQSFTPSGATEVYFNALGWVNGNVTPRLTRIGIAPAPNRANAFRPLAVAVTLGGIASVCDPAAAAHATRGCPP
jgi:type IV fimbrial biogenesis protein FimT